MQTIKAFTSILLLLFAAHLKAQISSAQAYQDIVQLKNGSRLIGQITYYHPDSALHLVLQTGQTMRYSANQIKKVQMFGTDIIKTERSEKPYQFREKGLYNAFAVVGNFGRHIDIWGKSVRTHMGFGIQNSTGYMFNRLIGVGVGAGFDSYYMNEGNSDVLSVFGEARTYLRRNVISEYISFVAGYGQPLKIEDENLTSRSGGFMIQPTVGWRLGGSNRYNFFVDLGMRVQRVHFFRTTAPADFPVTDRYTMTYRRWILRGGILF
jgi:hypothetical protein